MSSARLLPAYLGWALLWVVVQALLLWSVGIGPGIALSDALLTNLLLVGAGHAMSKGLRYYQPGLWQGAYLFGWSLGLAGLCLTLFYGLTGKLHKGDQAYLAFVEATLAVRMVYAWLMVLLLLLLSWMWFYTRERRQDEDRKAAAEKLAREAELYNLRQQLQPHFLFNSLNSISALVGARPEQARQMIQQLSDFLRGTLRQEQQQLVTLEEELQQLQLYLEIEKVRFGHRLQTTLEIDEAARQMRLPALLLQPVVENAIKFGLYGTLGPTVIALRADAQDHLHLQIRNPYDPDTLRSAQGTGFGLNSIRRRLYLLYARQDLLGTRQEENVFITTINIPQ